MQPIIISAVGTYVMRNGRTARITEIKDNGATNNCHGYLQKAPNKKGVIKEEWSIWSPAGCFNFLGESPRDIVGVIE